MTKNEIIEAAARAGACREGLAWAEQDNANWQTIPPCWAFWLRVQVPDLDPAARRRAEEAACRNAHYAYLLRVRVRDLDPDARRRTEEAACRDAYSAYWMRREANDLDPDARRRAEEAACLDPYYAYMLRVHVRDLDPAARRLAEEAAGREPRARGRTTHSKTDRKDRKLSSRFFARGHAARPS